MEVEYSCNKTVRDDRSNFDINYFFYRVKKDKFDRANKEKFYKKFLWRRKMKTENEKDRFQQMTGKFQMSDKEAQRLAHDICQTVQQFADNGYYEFLHWVSITVFGIAEYAGPLERIGEKHEVQKSEVVFDNIKLPEVGDDI